MWRIVVLNSILKIIRVWLWFIYQIIKMYDLGSKDSLDVDVVSSNWINNVLYFYCLYFLFCVLYPLLLTMSSSQTLFLILWLFYHLVLEQGLLLLMDFLHKGASTSRPSVLDGGQLCILETENDIVYKVYWQEVLKSSDH